MSKKIFSINYEIPGKSDFFKEFSSKSSLMDADILLFSPDEPNGDYNEYQGKPSYDEGDSFQYKEDIQHWKKELLDFLNMGRTVFLFLKEKKQFFLKTGEKEYKSKMTISHVGIHDNYEFLPVKIGTITTAKGSVIDYSGHALFSNLFNNFKGYLEYQVYLEEVTNSIVIFRGKDKSRVLGAIYKVEKGHLIVLPYIEYDEENFVENKKEKNGEEREYWNKEGIKFGNMLIDCLLEIDKGLREELGKTNPPEWLLENRFISPLELKIKNEIDENNRQIKIIEQKNGQLNENLRDEEILKDLLYEQGVPLENSVLEALKILGFKAENFDDGKLELDQVITDPEGRRYVGECEGKDDKDINITKLRQLIESLNADFEREEVKEKGLGILFGNPQRLIEPSKRSLDFTEKCKTAAVREKIALVKTSDLFVVVQYLKEKKDLDFQLRCRQAIFSGLGKIVKFPDLPKS